MQFHTELDLLCSLWRYFPSQAGELLEDSKMWGLTLILWKREWEKLEDVISKAYRRKSETGLQMLGSLQVWMLDSGWGDVDDKQCCVTKQEGKGLCRKYKQLKIYQLKMKEVT